MNRDASLSCRAPDSGASDRHVRAAPGGCSGNVVRPLAARGAGRVQRSLRRNRFGRDHSSCRSGSGCGRRRTETAGQIEPRAAQPGRRHVDERHDCQDIGPAYVSSTVWGTASMRARQVGLGAVLAPQGRNATPPLLATSGHGRPTAPHRSRRHLVTYLAIADMLFRGVLQAVDIIPPLQALRARYARVRTAVDNKAAISTIVRRTHIARHDDGNGRCNASSPLTRRSISYRLTHLSTATSILADTSWRPGLTAPSARRRSMSGSRRRASGPTHNMHRIDHLGSMSSIQS